jgi:protein DJ-1
MTKALILIADGTEEMELYALCSHLLVILYLPVTASTITYDTLVRAGVECTSAFIAAGSDNNATFNSPPFARGSRGINILPDMYFSPQECVPVRTFTLILEIV